MTFDSEIELMKVSRAHPKAKLVLRIATDDSKAVCRLSVKFGATLKTSRLLLERAKELNIDVIGVSFHVGSGCTDPETFVQALSDARCVFDMGVSTCDSLVEGLSGITTLESRISLFCITDLNPSAVCIFITCYESGSLTSEFFLVLDRSWFQHVSA